MMPAASPSTTPRTKKPSLAFQVMLFTLTRLVLNTSLRMVYPFLSLFQSGLGVGLAEFSALFTARSLVGGLGPLLAPLADRRGRKVSILLGIGLFVVGAVFILIWPTFPMFFASSLLMVLAYQVYLPAMQAYLGDRVEYTRRGRVMGITELSWSASFILGVPLVGWLLSRTGNWLSPFPLLAGLGLVALVTLVVYIPADGAGRVESSASAAKLNFGKLFTTPNVVLGLLMGLCMTTANESVNLVFGLWMEDAFQFKLAALGAAAIVLGLAELGGEGVSAGWVDRMGKEKAVRIGLWVNILAALALVLLGRSVTGALAGLFLFYLSFEFALVSALPMMSEALPELRATVMASTIASFALGRAVGALMGPFLYTTFGFQANAGFALGINILALFLLSRIRLVHGS